MQWVLLPQSIFDVTASINPGLDHEPLITLSVDGSAVTIRSGATILDAVRAAGVDVPTLCYHAEIDASANCRLCTVQVDTRVNGESSPLERGAADRGEGKLLPGCRALAEEGQRIHTLTPDVARTRGGVLSLLTAGVDLSDAPELQAMASEYEIGDGRLIARDPKPVLIDNPFYVRDYDKCVMCWRCTDVCGDEVQHTFAIEPAGRGFDSIIGTINNAGMKDTTCVFCGNCVGVCPTGALKPKILWDLEQRSAPLLETEERVVDTVCSFCGVGCNLEAHVRGGAITHVTSASDSPVNQGWLCVKGRYGFDYVDSEKRITTPLIKRNGQWEEATWEEALNLTAERLAYHRDTHGPDSLGVYASSKCTNEDNYYLQKFVRAVLGTNNIDNCTRLCHSSSVAALGMTIGTGAFTNSLDEIAENDVIYVTGSNTTETHPITALKMKKAVKNGAKLIVADPRSIELTGFADVHLQFRTGTDVPLYNALLHCIIRDGTYDREFVEARVHGFDGVAEVAAHYTPEYAESITGIPASTIEEAARIIAAADKTAFYWGLGISEHTHGTEACLTLINLALATGNVGRRGTGLNPLRGQNNVQGTSDVGAIPMYFSDYRSVESPEHIAFFEQAWGAPLPREEGLTTVEIADAVGNGEIRALFVMGENPLMSDPDLNHVREAFADIDFLAVQDIFMTETAEYADVFLPASSWAEKEGTYTNTDRRVQRVRKLRDLPGQAREDWEIIHDLAARMDYDMGCSSPAEIFDEIARLTPSHAGLSHDRMDREGGIRWPCPSPDHPGELWLFGDRFPTEDGKATMHPVDFRESTEIPDDEYPLIFNTGRVLYHWHGGSITRTAKGLDEIYPEALIEISPEDADSLGIQKSGKVRVSSRRGTLECRAWITKRVPPGTVYMGWHFHESAANLLTINALDPISKIPEYKICACRIERIDEDSVVYSDSLRAARA